MVVALTVTGAPAAPVSASSCSRSSPIWRILGPEVAAQVAEPGGREERVAAGVGGDVPVGVPGQALWLVGEVQAGHVQGYAVHQGVHVGADAGAWEGHAPIMP